MNYSVF